ncbi:MAG: tRNA (N6-isopentenyl adenosine(37)-C2)-methylthiotransferase MiaB [Desulfovibrionales bacterium]|nr:tRNA (N6-isopentenyl adenosine(37)-C2)-methylthiotransferase MiaB [Desulfovibrionales bacterium]
MIERTFHVMTFGCQMNVSDSDWLKRTLTARGFVECEQPEDASIFIVNTCSVREKPEQKVYSLLGRINQMTKGRKDVLVAVGGCVAQQVGRGFFKRFKQVRLVFGTDGLSSAPQALDRLVEEPSLRISLLDFSEEYPDRDGNWDDADVPVSSFVNIMTGCDNFCAYCIVPYTRGRQKSRPTQAILDECKELLSRGTKEITLLGQNVNSFGQDSHGDGTSFTELLYKVAALDGLKRLRFVTSHPKDIADGVIEAFGELDVLCPRLHLPLQSGSDQVLKKMGRKYDVAQYLSIVEKLKAVRPDIQLTTDIIVGFPGETEEDFLETMRIAKIADYAQSFSFNYSDRPGTRAEKLPIKVEKKVMQDRLARYQAWQTDNTERILQSMVGKKLDILFEGVSRRPQTEGVSWQGRDIYGQLVIVDLPEGEDVTGEIHTVKVTKATRHVLIAEKAGDTW